MTTGVNSGLRSTEAAARLGIEPRDVYSLLFAGDLEGGPDGEGVVRFAEASVERYRARRAGRTT